MSHSGELLAHEEAASEHIVDADFHLHMPPENLYPYVEDSMIRKKLEHNGPPPFGGKWPKTAYSKAPESAAEEPWAARHGGAFTAEDISAVKERMGIDVTVVTPGTSIPLGRGMYPRVSNALTKAYNDYVLDKVVDIDDGIYASAFVPHWDVEFAVEELDRVGSEPAIVAGQNWMTTERLWGDYEYDPIFEKLVSLDLPLQLHIKKLSTGPQLRRLSMATQVEKLIASDGYAALANVINMIMTGVFDDFPELQVLVQEAGVLWIPYMAWRADDLYQSYTEDLKLSERFHDKDKEYLDRMPSDYLFDHFSVTTQPMSIGQVKPRSHIQPLLEVCHAEDMFLYSSDWPHGTLDPVDWLFDLPIDEELRHDITHNNAQQLLRFPE
jgi:predicted TIM-barrel fold metal-dependent hydrolase